MAAVNIIKPLLPTPPSWYPGHMAQFAKALPALLTKTDVVLELRDARLPLTSINGTLEVALQRWRKERGRMQVEPAQLGATNLISAPSGPVCERIVLFNKRDLVPEWGLDPFQKAMQSRFPDQRILFTSWHRQRDIQSLNRLLVKIAKNNPDAPELNVLVVGMPNVGKSTLLNALRNVGIQGPVAKALRTSALPGLTRALSTRLKLSQVPLVYAYDSPGVMLPYLGRGEAGAERGTKLALIAGLKEGLYAAETLASYLLYRFNLLDPHNPAYLTLLPPGAKPTQDIDEFLDALARRLGMLGRGGVRDIQRAADWFVRWWREDGALLSARAPLALEVDTQSAAADITVPGAVDPKALAPPAVNPDTSTIPEYGASQPQHRGWGFDLEWTEAPGDPRPLQARMEAAIDAFTRAEEDERADGGGVSARQEKLQEKAAQREKSAARVRAILAARKSAPGGGGGKKTAAKRRR